MVILHGRYPFTGHRMGQASGEAPGEKGVIVMKFTVGLKVNAIRLAQVIKLSEVENNVTALHKKRTTFLDKIKSIPNFASVSESDYKLKLIDVRV